MPEGYIRINPFPAARGMAEQAVPMPVNPPEPAGCGHPPDYNFSARQRACRTCGKWACCAGGCRATGDVNTPGHVMFSVRRHEDVTQDDGLIYAVCADHVATVTTMCRMCGTRGHVGYVTRNGCPACLSTCRDCRAEYSVVRVHRCAAAARLRINNYTYKPDVRFFGRSRKNLFFGIEQEVEARPGFTPEEVAANVLELDRHRLLYAKSDSSMYRGVEFVSHPMTFAWFTQNYPRDLAAKLHEVADNNYEGAYTCGVHVHVSRAAFTGYHLYKFVQFFLLNPEFIQSVAGRGDTCADARRGEHKVTAYEKEALITNPDDGRVTLRNGVQVRLPSGDIVYSVDAAIRNFAFAGKQRKFPWDVPPNRYVAVNLQNRQTVEVRVFKGTTKFERLLAYIQFMDAVYAYTEQAHWHTKNPLRGLTEVGFREYIKNYPRRYADLHHLLAGDEPWATA